jgi:hypothetical protein
MKRFNGISAMAFATSNICFITAEDPEFAAFEAAGAVEVGEPDLAEEEGEKPAKKAAAKPAAKPEAKPEAGEGEGAENADDAGENDSDGENEDEEKQRPDPKESQINRLKREKAELAKQLRQLQANGGGDMAARLEALENRLQGNKSGDNSGAGKISPPDPSDVEKYPLGRLDDRYIEDRIEYGLQLKATEQADAVLQREQEIEQQQSIQREQTELLGKVDELSAKGSELFDDFQETVVEAGMRGDWDLSQTTFEAAAEADNGAQILYELSQDTKEASRVAKLSPLAQLKYVNERDTEIGKGKTPRTKPGATPPPQNLARGANSRTSINPATDNLDDFEKAWEADAKKSR